MLNHFKSCQLSHKPDPQDPQKRITVETWEHAAESSAGNFSEPGDSGSWVFTREGMVVGMVWGGSANSEVSYVTPIEAILDDIKQVTGAAEARIAVTQTSS